jgi:hypothetical protein
MKPPLHLMFGPKQYPSLWHFLQSLFLSVRRLRIASRLRSLTGNPNFCIARDRHAGASLEERGK